MGDNREQFTGDEPERSEQEHQAGGAGAVPPARPPQTPPGDREEPTEGRQADREGAEVSEGAAGWAADQPTSWQPEQDERGGEAEQEEEREEEVLEVDLEEEQREQVAAREQAGMPYGGAREPSGYGRQPPGPGGPGYVYGPRPPQQPPRAPRRGMSGCVIAILIALGLVVVGGVIAAILFTMMSVPSAGTGISVGGEYVGVIHISGLITSGGQATFFGPTTYGALSIMEQLRNAGETDAIKAVLIRVNSPGGSAAASQEIYQEVMRLRERKPVIVSMADVAASGGYYVSSGATKIVADPATLTGSIGVIMQSMSFHELASKYGVDENTFTSGKYKDLMNPLRPMTEDERELAQNLVDDVYEDFVKDVATARKDLTESKVRELADGRIFTGRQAQEAGLVDELGNYHDAVKMAAEEGGIKGKPKTKTLGGGRGWYGLFGSLASEVKRGQLSEVMPLPARLGPGMWMVWQGTGTVVRE